MHLPTESSLLNPISICFRNSAYCANVNDCGCSEHHITPDPYDFSFSMHCQKAYIKVTLRKKLYKTWFIIFFFFFYSNFHLQNTSEDQLMHTALGHNLIPWIFLTVNKNKKKNNSDLQVSSWKVFLPKSCFLFLFLFYPVMWITNSLCQNLIQVFDQPNRKNSFLILQYINKAVGQRSISES